MDEIVQSVRSQLANVEFTVWRTQLVADGLRIAFVLLLTLGISKLISRSLSLAFEQMKRSKEDGDALKRLETVRRLTVMVVRIFVWSVGGLIVLSILGISVAPLLTAAGITGVAAGFAAQNLVKNYLSGFALMLQGHVRVGDIVELGGYSGVVEEITFHAVRLRDYSGQVIFVPCGSIGTIVNKSMGFAQAVIDVGVAYREDADQALAVMRRVAQEMAADPAWCSRIIDAPELVGVEAFLDSAVQLRLRMKVVPGAQWDVRREYLRRIKKAFDAAGIEIPFPHLTLYPGVPKEGAAPALNVKLVAAPAGQAAEATEKPIARDEHTAPPLE